MASLIQDLRFAIRALRARPGLTLAAAISLGAGIGSNTIVFTWMERFVLRPLPMVTDFHRLVSVQTRAPEDQPWSLSYPSFRDWRGQSRTVDLAVSRFFQGGLRSDRGIDRVWAQAVSNNYFDVLGVRPLFGRVFRLDEETGAAPVAVLGYGLWRERFGSDPAVIGRSLTLNGHPVTIIGVAPPGFGGTVMGLSFDLYFPLTIEPLLTGRPSWLESRGWQSYEGVARLRDGVTLQQARTEIDAIARRVATANGDQDVRGAFVEPFANHGGPALMRPALRALLGITAVVLLIACANVASLLLARAVARRREIGIRLALGASRGRLIRQLLTESLVLAILAGGVGMLVAIWGRNLMYSFVPPAPFPISFEIRMTNRVLVFTALLTGLTALLFGLLPALKSSRPDVVASLKDEIGEGRPRRLNLQTMLVVSQVALSVLSLVAAGLFVRSLEAANHIDVGFTAPEQVLLVTSDLSLAGYSDSAAIPVMERLLEKVRAIPGVEAAGAASMVPLGFGGGGSSSTDVEGYVPAAGENTSIQRSTVTPGYFEALGIPIVRGRSFNSTDEDTTARVAIVNQAFVNRFWADQDPIGRRLKQGGEWLRVVGVAKQGKYQQLDESPMPVVYRILGQGRDLSLTTHIRVKGDPWAMVPVLRTTFASVGPDIPFLDVRTMAEHMGASLFAQRIAAWMLAAFGVVALLLSAVGIYGVLSHLVSRRTREIGVRLALGASRREVMGMVLHRSARQVGLGLLIGAGLAFATGRLLHSQLLGISPADPLTYGTIATLLALVALLATWFPARRAARVDPMVALKTE